MTAHLWPVLPDIRKSTVLFECFQALPACPSDKSTKKMKMTVEHCLKNTDILAQYHCLKDTDSLAQQHCLKDTDSLAQQHCLKDTDSLTQ